MVVIPCKAPGLHGGGDLMNFALAYEIADGRRRDEDLRGYRSAALGRLDELLGHHRLKRGRQLDPHLLLLERRKHVDDALYRLRSVLGMQSGEDQVPGLGRCQCRGYGLEITDLTYQDHIGILTQDMFECCLETVGVGSNLTLIDDGGLVAV